MAYVPGLKSRRVRLDMPTLRSQQQSFSDEYGRSPMNQKVLRAKLDLYDRISGELQRLTDETMKWNEHTSPRKADALLRRCDKLTAKHRELDAIPEVHAAVLKREAKERA